MDNAHIESYMVADKNGHFTIMCPMCDVACYTENSYDGPVCTCEQCGERYFIGR